MLRSVLGAFTAAAFLHAFYAGVQTKWPENYFSVERSADPIVSRRMTRYAFFRAAPVYLVASFLIVTLDRLTAPTLFGLSVFVLLHCADTNARGALVQIQRRHRPAFSATALAFHILAVILIGLTGLAAFWTRSVWRPLIPEPAELAGNIWAGAIAAVFVSYLLHLTLDERTTESLVDLARGGTGERLRTLARRRATEYKTDGYLIEAILLAESLQRPKWVRRPEYLKGRFFKRGTYGIMQVASPFPISDEESIEKVAQSYSGWRPRRTDSGVRPSELQLAFERHNRSRDFVELAQRMYDAIQPVVWSSSSVVADDGRFTVEVFGSERSGDTWLISGSASEPIVYVTRSEGSEQTTAVERGPDPGRQTWFVKVPLAAEAVRFWTIDGSGEPKDEPVHVDLSYQ